MLLTILLITTGNLSIIRPIYAQGGRTGEILNLVNQVRAGYGLPAYTWDSRLAAAAQAHAEYMAANNIYSHTGVGGSSPQSRALSAGYAGIATENIVGGSNLTPNQGVTWWRNSPIHFNTMISQRYIHAGVGFAQGHDQNFFALVVGVPSDQVQGQMTIPQETTDNELLAPVAPIELAQPRDDGSIVHIVGSGQSFWAIAARYEVELEQIYLFNNLNQDSVINPGDELIIRLAEGQEPPPTPTPPAFHIVGKGESLWTIAAWYKLSLEELLRLNSLEEDSLVQPGDEVKIRLLPGESPPPTATPQINHVIQSGDTAWGIALKYGLALDELLQFNNLSENAVLSIGDILLIVPPTIQPSLTPTPTASQVPTPTLTPSPSPESTKTPSRQLISEAISNSTPDSDVDTDYRQNSSNPQVTNYALILGLGMLFLGVGALVFVRFLK